MPFRDVSCRRWIDRAIRQPGEGALANRERIERIPQRSVSGRDGLCGRRDRRRQGRRRRNRVSRSIRPVRPGGSSSKAWCAFRACAIRVSRPAISRSPVSRAPAASRMSSRRSSRVAISAGGRDKTGYIAAFRRPEVKRDALHVGLGLLVGALAPGEVKHRRLHPAAQFVQVVQPLG